MFKEIFLNWINSFFLKGQLDDYREVGRVVATLMSDEVMIKWILSILR